MNRDKVMSMPKKIFEWKKLHTLKSIVDDLENENVGNAFPYV